MGIDDKPEQPAERSYIPEHVELFRPTARVNPSKVPSVLDALDKSRASKAEKKHERAVAKARKERLAAEARAAIQSEAEQRAAEKAAREASERADLEASKAEVRAERAARVAAEEAAAMEARVREAQLVAAEKQAAAEEKVATDAAAAQEARREKERLVAEAKREKERLVAEAKREKDRLAEEAKLEKARAAALAAAEAKLVREKKIPKPVRQPKAPTRLVLPSIPLPKIVLPTISSIRSSRSGGALAEKKAPNRSLAKVNKRVVVAVGAGIGVLAVASGIWLSSLQYIRPTQGMKTDKGPAASIVAVTDYSTTVATGETVVALLGKQPDGKEITIMGTVRSQNADTVFVSDGNTIWSVKPSQIMGKVLFTLPRG